MRKYKVTPMQRKDGRWYWHAVASNGKIVFSGAEGDGFATKRGAVSNFMRVCAAFREWQVELVI